MASRYSVALAFLAFVIFVPVANANQPPPAPRVYAHFQMGSPCADGSFVEARLTEVKGSLWFDRSKCRDQFSWPTFIGVPKGANAIQTGFLIYDGKLFEDAMDTSRHAVLYCRSEQKGRAAKNGIVAVIWAGADTKLTVGVSGTTAPSWSAVRAEGAALPSGGFYAGHGDINKQDTISLAYDPRNRSADVTYSYEIGVGAVGQRPKAEGAIQNLHCYQP